MPKLHDLIGQRFGRLIVTSREIRPRGARWICKCDCGGEAKCMTCNLRSGISQSCGCLQRERASEGNTTHRMKGTPTHNSWTALKQRCRGQAPESGKNYVDRGISVCARWLGEDGFENFLADMGEKPAGTSIDRIDNSKGYEPSNCRWATRRQQNQNRRNVRLLTHNGITKCVAEWARELGLRKTLIYRRLDRGDSAEQALRPVA